VSRKRNALILTALVGVFAVPAQAQLYGTSPFQNGPNGTAQASLQKFDPDTGLGVVDPLDPMIRPEARQITLAGFTVTGVNSVTVDPTDGSDPAIPVLPGDPDDNEDFAYAILKVSGVTGRVLALVDLNTGVARQLGNLGDNFAALTFDASGQLYGITGDGAAVPETLYSIDKLTGVKTLKYAMGNGADGEAIAFNPQDNFFYHWSGNGTVVWEKMALTNVTYSPVNIPLTSPTNGETFGAVWDPCRDLFIGSNFSNRFNLWRPNPTPPDPMISAQFGDNPDDERGLALIGGYSCDVDLNIGMTASNLVPVGGEYISLTVTVTNTKRPRALTPTVDIALAPGIIIPTTTGCAEDPAGIPTCTLPTLLKGESIAFTIDAIFGGAGMNTATVTTGSDEIAPADNTVTLGVGFPEIFENGFED
jgi:hypothetical protein